MLRLWWAPFCWMNSLLNLLSRSSCCWRIVAPCSTLPDLSGAFTQPVRRLYRTALQVYNTTLVQLHWLYQVTLGSKSLNVWLVLYAFLLEKGIFCLRAFIHEKNEETIIALSVRKYASEKASMHYLLSIFFEEGWHSFVLSSTWSVHLISSNVKDLSL